MLRGSQVTVGPQNHEWKIKETIIELYVVLKKLITGALGIVQ